MSSRVAKDGVATRPKRRVRPLLLVLLWIWAGCVFLVLDLFLNIEEFDAIRPRAEVYRSARFAAHEMTGEPYRENDLLGARRVIESRKPARPGPPKAFRGTKLEWRINRSYLSESELAGVLRDIDTLGQRERLAVLRSLRLRPDPAMAGVLAEIGRKIPNDASSLANYSFTCVSMLRAVMRREFAELDERSRIGRRWLPSSLPYGDQLVDSFLEAERALVTSHGHRIDGKTWGGVRLMLDEVEQLFPGYRKERDYSEAFAAIEEALLATLAKAKEPMPGYRGGVGAFVSRPNTGERPPSTCF